MSSDGETAYKKVYVLLSYFIYSIGTHKNLNISKSIAMIML
jgi:hypothetical protein